MDNYTEEEFHDISVDYGKSTSISQVGMEVLAPSNFDIKLRMTPLDDVQDIAERLSEEEGDLCIAGPSIDIEDVPPFPKFYIPPSYIYCMACQNNLVNRS